MGIQYDFDYFYGIEANQFSFYRIPRMLIKDPHFKELSSDAKLLYGLMLDRMAMSIKNGWLDEDNRVYIYYTLEDIMEDLGCARATCVRILSELDAKKGIGLIEKKRQGLGKPDIIYVKNFVSVAKESKTEVQNTDFQKFSSCTSESSDSEPVEVQNLNPNYNNNNYTEWNYNNPIYPASEEGIGSRSKTHDYREIIAENIEYRDQMRCLGQSDAERYTEMYELICDVVTGQRKNMIIGGSEYTAEYVRERFLKLRSAHLLFVLHCLDQTDTKINNIRSYLTTALFHSISTIGNYYNQEVRHDMYGGGWAEKGIV